MINSISRSLYKHSQAFNRLTSNLWISLYSRIIGLRFVKCNFYGVPTLSFFPGSLVKIGKGCTFRSSHRSNLIGVNHPCMLSTFAKDAALTIGDNCGFSGTVIGCFMRVTLGNNVRCGANTVISDGDWHAGDVRVGDPMPVEIGDNVWLGLNVLVLKGVSIGENTIIGAGSVVTGNIPPNVIAAGNPCRVIRQLL